MKYAFLILSIAALVLMAAGCQQTPDAAAAIEKIVYTSTSVDIILSAPTSIQSVTVLTYGWKVLTKHISATPRTSTSVVFDWQAKTSYVFRVTLRSGRVIEVESTSPSKSGYLVDVTLDIPYGRSARLGDKASASQPAIVPEGGEVLAYLEMSSNTNAYTEAGVNVILPADITPVDVDYRTDESKHENIVHFTTAFEVAYDKQIQTIALKLPAGVEKEFIIDFVAHCKANIDGKITEWQIKRKATIQSMKIEKIASFVSISNVVMPTDANGKYDRTTRPDTIVTRDATGDFLRKLFAQREKLRDYSYPYTYQTVSISNSSDYYLPIVLSCDFTVEKTGEKALGFRSPGGLGTGYESAIVSATLKPNVTSKVALPIFINPAKLPGGQYRRNFEIRLLGVHHASLTQESLPVAVVASNDLAFVITAFAVVVTFIGFVVFLFVQKRFFRRFKVKWLTTIALMGTITFVSVNLPSSLFFTFLSVFPFSFLVYGIFSEIMYYMLLVALLRLIPKPGVVLVATLVRVLINGVFFGDFSPAGLFYAGMKVFILESILYAGGITSKRNILEAFSRHRWVVGIVVGVLIGLADAIGIFVHFHLSIFLYRLYYAYWYIWLSVLISGFLYSFIGAQMGLRLGSSIRKVVD